MIIKIIIRHHNHHHDDDQKWNKRNFEKRLIMIDNIRNRTNGILRKINNGDPEQNEVNFEKG